MQIIVTMERMLCAKPTNKWYFFRATMGGDGVPETTIVCKGAMGWQPQELETLALIGEFVEYKGERQFQFKSAKLTLPLEPRSQLHYVCERAKGIGPAIEQAIWDARGENWRDLERCEVRKLTDAAYDRFREQINSFESNSEKAEIISWLENKGCSSAMAAAAYEAWGADTAGVVNADCYRLAQLAGYSFRTVDENIRRHFEIADDDPRRIKSAVEYAMQQETEDGSTAVNCWRHLASCQKLLPNVGDELVLQYVREMKADGGVYVFTKQCMMALKRDYLNELMIYDMARVAGTMEPDTVELNFAELAAGESFTPDDSQIEAARSAITRRFAIVNGGAGVGKCLGRGTPVLMYDGTVKEVQDLRAGDVLMGPDSKPRHIVGTTSGREEMFRITPKKGDAFTCNRSHILSVKYTKKLKRQYTDDKMKPFNISVDELLTWPENQRAEVKAWRTGVEFAHSEVPLDPYFVGLWLGDGYAQAPSISNPDPETIDYLRDFARKNQVKITEVKQAEGKCPTWNISAADHPGKYNRNPITKSMRELRLLGNKHIPRCYKVNSREIRLNILAGLIDSDGYVIRGSECEITQKNAILAHDIVFLARSLGFCATIKATRKQCVNTGAWGIYHRINISGELSEIPTKVERKKFRPRKQIKSVLHTGISIESIGKGEYYGFTLAESDGLFLLGDFTVTHNTTIIKMIVRGIRQAYPKLTVALCAPTGKAAARLKEASGIEATTIHLLLGARGDGIFSAGALEQYAIVVDESSMVDSALLAEIVKRNPARLVLVGDQAQLTPVGHGQPFHDLIQIHPDLVRTLSKCYRNTEAVFQAATQIRKGNLPPRTAQSENERWTVVAAPKPELAQEVVAAWARDGVLDFATDIVLCPKNGKRDESEQFQAATVNAFNEELLRIDRDARNMFGAEKFMPGDRVINTENNAEAQVWNGTTGTIHAVNDEHEVFVQLDVPVKDEITGEPKWIIRFDKDMIKALRYAYALTVHKSQGSQYRKVVMVVLARDLFTLDRSLVYTGVTRTRVECVVVGDYSTFAKSIQSSKKKDTVLQCLSEAEHER